MVSLLEHARRELVLVGEDEATIEEYLSVVKAFAEMGHSGLAAQYSAIPTLMKLLQYRNLSPLTTDPNEWTHIPASVWGAGRDIWQSVRDPEAFSHDHGKTYTRASDLIPASGDRITYTSVQPNQPAQ